MYLKRNTLVIKHYQFIHNFKFLIKFSLILSLIMYFSLSFAKANNLDDIIYSVKSMQNILGQKNESNLSFSKNLNTDRISSKLSININDNKVKFHNSYAQFEWKNSYLGFGQIDRDWSYSTRTSLVMSSSAQKMDSVYFNMTGSKLPFINTLYPWSINAFSSVSNDALKNSDSILTGTRVTVSPTSRLQLEFIRMIQWGGLAYKNNLENIIKIYTQDTNDGEFSDVNQMAGIGYSYNFASKKLPIRLYSQIIGEDEAGLLPTCLMHLIGFEWNGSIMNKNTLLGIENIDTRIDKSSHNNCGPNTAYNNNTYSYTHNGFVLGTPIDSESVSYEIFGSTKISDQISIGYSLKSLNINNANSNLHRLSSKNQEGWIQKADFTWLNNKIKIKNSITYNGLNLEKTSLKKGLGLNILASVRF
jgi:hypothetical protein